MYDELNKNKEYIEFIINQCKLELSKSFKTIEWDWDSNYIFITVTYDSGKTFNVDIPIKDISFEEDSVDDNVEYVLDMIYDTYDEIDIY